jgi:hypothetical protein
VPEESEVWSDHRSVQERSLAMCECDARPTTGPAAVSQQATSGASSAVMVQVPQEIESKIAVRLLPIREVVLESVLGCQPRRRSPRRDAQPIPLPEGLAAKLKGANKRMIEWLARDSAAPGQFMADPVGTLVAAGVELSRAEQKALSRAHEAVRDVAVVPPGMKVAKFTVKATRSGKVGDIFRTSQTRAKGSSGSGC